MNIPPWKQKKPRGPRIHGVAAKHARKYKDRVYHSKMEMYRAIELDQLQAGGVIKDWTPQVTVPLGADFKTIVDFKVTYIVNNRFVVGYEEIKGFETERFKITRRLWKKYGPAKLLVMKRAGAGRWHTEIITPDAMKTKETR